MYSGPSLAHLFDLDHEIERLLRDLADEGGERMTDHTRTLTPVGHRPFEPDYVPGRLRESINKKLTVAYFSPSHGCMVYESGSETNLDYAPYVEHGTGLWGPARAKYEIRPRNPDGWLRFHDEAGNVIFAKRVLHPGSPGAHMFTRGAAATEADMHLWIRRKVDEWEREVDLVMQARARERVLRS